MSSGRAKQKAPDVGNKLQLTRCHVDRQERIRHD